MAIKKWEKIKTEEVYECGGFYHIEKDKVLTPGGKEGIFYVIRKKPIVVIIPIDEVGNLYLTRQFRYPINQFSTEFPMGGSEKSNIEKEARRELEEEMGLQVDFLEEIGSVYLENGIGDPEAFVFLAKNIFPIKNPATDPLDKNVHETVIYSKKELEEKIIAGEIKDSSTISAFYLAEKKGLI